MEGCISESCWAGTNGIFPCYPGERLRRIPSESGEEKKNLLTLPPFYRAVFLLKKEEDLIIPLS